MKRLFLFSPKLSLKNLKIEKKEKEKKRFSKKKKQGQVQGLNFSCEIIQNFSCEIIQSLSLTHSRSKKVYNFHVGNNSLTRGTNFPQRGSKLIRFLRKYSMCL